MSTRTFFIAALICLFPATLAWGQDTVSRNFDVRPGGALEVDMDFGDLVVRTTRDNQVRVEVERDLDVDLHELTIEARGNRVVIESEYDENGRRWNNVRVDVTVYMPESWSVAFNTGAGNVEIDPVDGDVTGSTGAGNVTLDGVGGLTDLQTGAGNIEVEAAGGRIDVRTGAGNVDVTLVRALDKRSELRSGAGNVTVYVAKDLSLDIDARASVGSASCAFGLRERGEFLSRSCEGEINGGGPELSLSSGVGNVSVRRR
ncbi:MAG: hypothetical protein RIE53_11960 [Rhodothermales bacterium]